MSKRKNIQSVEMESPDLNDERLAALKDLFPEAFSEGKIDFPKLRESLGELADERPERYSFSWAGKRDAIRILQTPSRATLKPCREESVNFDETKHLFLEGDNLEVLKLLYKSYAGRVKMIYIDPPYNTGKDFIYPDNFADPLDTYLRLTGQKDAEGNVLTSNPETSGRYHSAWLSMMYPRLFIARQLLREDGVIFVSIDDHEVPNLRMVMNEIFGEENFLACFVRKRRMATGMRGEPISPDHEYVLSFARNSERVMLHGTPQVESDYPFQDSKGKYRSTDLTVGMTKEMRPNQWYALTNPQTGNEYWPPDGRIWRFQPSTMKQHIKDNNIIWPEAQPEKRLSRPRFKTRFDPDSKLDTTSPVSTWIDSKNGRGNGFPEEESLELIAGLNQEGTKELRDLFGEQLLEYPKPTSLLDALVRMSTRKDDMVLDFFSGSSTCAHSTLNENAKGEANRRFIMVQLQEPTDDNSTAQIAGYKTVAEIGKERIRRVIAKMKSKREGELDLQTRGTPEDLGFRVFKLDESHFRRWTGTAEKDPGELTEQMELFNDPLLSGWKPEDVLWEIILKEGLSLTSHMEKVTADSAANTVWRVTDDDKNQTLLICLDDKLNPKTIRALEIDKETRFICRDAALTDELAANLALQCRLKTI